MKKLINLSLVILIVATISCDHESTFDPIPANYDGEQLYGVAAKASKATVDVIDAVNSVMAGTSTLHRTSNGITVNFKATGLIPGHTYTVWWVIWNFPGNCADFPGPCSDPDFANAEDVGVEVLYAAGHVVGNSGKGNFSAHLNENDDSASINPLFELPPAGGLLDAETAEVHLVLRSHGPAIPGQVNDQISSYEGGCTDPFAFPPFSEVPDEAGECGDIYFSIHQP